MATGLRSGRIAGLPDAATSRFPHPLALLTACILLAAAATWLLPAGRYERRHDPATDREVVVPGTFRPVAAQPVGPFRAIVAIPKGFAAAADVIALVFLVGGAFGVVEQTGALRRAVSRLVASVGSRERLVIPICCVAFAAGGATENMQEEIIPFVPVLLLLTRGLGFDALTAAAMSIGAAMVGSAFSPINPFQVLIAQKLSQLEPASGWPFRTAVLAIALALWTWGTARYALRHATPRDATALRVETARPGYRLDIILGLVLISFVLIPVGMQGLGWGFDELSAMFLIVGIAAGLIAGMGVSGTAGAFVEGFRAMAGAAILIGFARAISVVLEEGVVLDTIVHGLFLPVADLAPAVSAVTMMALHAAIHVPVPSVSGQAVLTMPILVPLSDLLGLSRQVAVLAYQYGAGLSDVLTPTNGALLAVLAASGVPYDRWLRFAAPLVALIALLGAAAIVVAVATGF